jgi:alpha-beta hydrolase superfamily lysophospholipase
MTPGGVHGEQYGRDHEDMTMETPDHSIHRRGFIQASSALAAGAASVTLPSVSGAAAEGRLKAEEFWTNKGEVKLYIYRKRLLTEGRENMPVLFLVHGSTPSSRGSFDLQVPGREYSVMDHFARLGFDVWTMDHEGYGGSTHGNGHCGIMVGVEDLKAALPLVERTTGKHAVMMYGQSSGAIRAGAFAVAEPTRVERLILDAFTYTGTNAPEIDRRRAAADRYRANPRRPVSLQTYLGIFNRDKPGTYEPAVAQILADEELKHGDTVPSGTYLDMAVNLPMVDPRKVQCPVCMLRAEHDGNASEEELLEFFKLLPSHDKQVVFLAGLTHAGMLGVNRHRIWHVMQEFLTYPPARTA